MSPLPKAEPSPGRTAFVSEDVLAELTDAAYRAALRHGLSGNFLDAQLDIWAALRAALDRQCRPTFRLVSEG